MILLNVNSPLPAARNPEAPTSRLPEGADFVDAEAVQRILAGPVCRRGSLFTGEAFLTAEDTDFAGWHPLTPQPARKTFPAAPVAPPQLATPVPQAAAPAFSKPGPPAAPVWFSFAFAIFGLGLLGLAILSQHPIAQPAAKWQPAQPPMAGHTAATLPEIPAIPQDLSSTTDLSR